MPPSLSRRRLGALAAALLAAPPVLAQRVPTTVITDIAGRRVEVPRGAKRMVLGEGRLLAATVLLDRDNPFGTLAAWGNDMRLFDPDAWRRYRARFPGMERIPELGSSYSGDFSAERVIALDADVVVFTLGSMRRMQDAGIIATLDRAGIPSVFVDVREEAVKNTVPSIEILGTIMDRPGAARAFADFYAEQSAVVRDRVKDLPDGAKPLAFIEQSAGYDPNECCRTWGDAYLGALLGMAGARNWGTAHFRGVGGLVNPEALLAEDPDLIIGTGANWAETKPDVTAVLLGYDATPAEVQNRLRALAQRPVFAGLKAVREGRFHSVYHQFYISPYHVVALQAFAKWSQPELFATLDPEATFRTLHERFLPIPYGGIFWATLERPAG
ncbi:ABC transporter substrate-binding protein [Falsiroseomonas sp. HW251]|uniref:ABC transporter substrate-binding protein n=1 Tax=Falsiroseomonas sp. HW251 TaxID=3390998 RepID=UPI003D31C061